MGLTKKSLKVLGWNAFIWSISFFGLLNVFAKSDSIRYLDVVYTLLFHIPLVLGVVWNQLAINHFLEKGRLKVYLLSFLLALIIIVQTYPLVFDVFAPFVFPDLYFVTVFEWFEILGIGLAYISLSLLLNLSKNWSKLKEKELELAKIEEEKTKSDLKALRAQINPHFLFNSLNSIYGETIKKSDKAPQMVIMLSDILRYVVENMEKQQISLEEELSYIKKYITFQKNRLNNSEQVKLTISGAFKGVSISPLLLITFIENAFKHGELSDTTKPITFNIICEKEELIFRVNNYKKIALDVGEEIERTSGMGLSNAKKRLEHSYANKHTLVITEDETYYKLELHIILS